MHLWASARFRRGGGRPAAGLADLSRGEACGPGRWSRWRLNESMGTNTEEEQRTTGASGHDVEQRTSSGERVRRREKGGGEDHSSEAGTWLRVNGGAAGEVQDDKGDAGEAPASRSLVQRRRPGWRGRRDPG